MPVTLTLTPARRDLAVGEVVSFAVEAAAQRRPLLGLDVEILFRPESVVVVNESGTAAGAVTPGPAFGSDRQPGGRSRGPDSVQRSQLRSGCQWAASGRPFLSARPAAWAGGGAIWGAHIGLNDAYVKVPLTLVLPNISVGGVDAYLIYLPLCWRH